MILYESTLKALKSNLRKLFNFFFDTFNEIFKFFFDIIDDAFKILATIISKILKIETSSEFKERVARQEREAVDRNRKKWLEEIEPKERHSPGYPYDWEWRRAHVYRMAEGKCENCGSQIGKLEIVIIYSFRPYYIERLIGAHVHHKVKISEGGDHSFSNLELLCSDCHAEKHPEKKRFLETTLVTVL